MAWTLRDSLPCLTIRLLNLSAGDLVVPSFAALDTETSVSIHAEFASERLILPRIPGESDAPLSPDNAWARVSIDCLEILQDIAELDIRFYWPEAEPPTRFLATVSRRPTELTVTAPPSLAVTPIASASFSQMTLAPDVAERCCSPVSLAMALMRDEPTLDVTALVAECRHPASGLYGVWPMATRAAARRGKLVSVEACLSFDAIARALASGAPVITSIRFGAGELKGAPLRETAGHLIVVRGIEDGFVVAHDPAAPDHDSVLRRYPIAEFTRAWLAQRGIAYLFAAAR